jgi:hypothetical protein
VAVSPYSVRISRVGLMLCVFAGSLPAQTSSGAGSAAATPNAQQTQDSKASPQSGSAATGRTRESGEKSSSQDDPPPKRMFGMIPDFENTNDTLANRQPLTVRQKYILSLHQAFDISAHIGDAFQAALQQAGNGQPHYGQGWGAYGERFAANEGDQISSSILIYGVLPSILHDDPRYFRQGRGSAMARLWYAINRTFVTRRDKGTTGFNTPETLGQLMAAGISTTYYPQRDRSVGHVFSNWAVNLGGNSGYNILSEYYPDLKRVFFHRRSVAVPQTGN